MKSCTQKNFLKAWKLDENYLSFFIERYTSTIFCIHKYVTDLNATIPELAEIIKPKISYPVFYENYDCTETIQETLKYEKKILFLSVVSNFLVVVNENETKCLKEKFDQTNFIARVLAAKSMEKFQVSDDIKNAEKKQFGKIMAQNSFTDCAE